MNTRSRSSEPISQAKRMFLVNLTLCALIGVSFTIRQLTRDPEATLPETESTALPIAETKSALEIAYFLGQAFGLSEDPRATLALSKKQLVRHATTALSLIAETAQSDNQEALITAYSKGYHEQFEHYYSDREGYDAGYRFGLKLDPTQRPQISENAIHVSLDRHKTAALEKYSLNDIQWCIFKQGFFEGYSDGYLQTKAGITAKLGEAIEIIEP